MSLLAVLVLVAIGVWIGREWAQGRRRQAFLATRDTRGQPVMPPPRRVDDGALAQHVEGLRQALARGDVTLEEAAGSLVRLTGGQLSTRAAVQRLQRG